MAGNTSAKSSVNYQLLSMLIILSQGTWGLKDASPPKWITIGSILDWDTNVGRVAKCAMKLTTEDVNRDKNLLNNTQLVVDFRDSKQDRVEGASAALALLGGQVVTIVGPQTSIVSEFVANLGSSANVPIVTFSATNPLLTIHDHPYFVRLAHNDAFQMQAVAAVVGNFGWKEVVVVYQNDYFGIGALPSLINAIKDVGSGIGHGAPISPQAEMVEIEGVLCKLMTMQWRVFVVHMQSEIGIRFFSQAEKMGMIESGYVWIISDQLASLLEAMNSSTIMSMQGIIGIRSYLPKSEKVEDFTRRWKRHFRAENPDIENLELNVYDLHAYDTVWMIARAIDEFLLHESFKFKIIENSKGLTNNIPVLQGGEFLLQLLLKTNFTGLSGPIQLREGELSTCIYEIVNVIGKSYRVVGSWRIHDGLLPPSNAGKRDSASKLNTVIWPGGSVKVPRGWVIPTNDNKLRVAVPLRGNGVMQFTQTVHNKGRNETRFFGFCLDVFEAIVNELDYDFSYEYYPYQIGNATYEDLIREVYEKKFDAAVGDISIIANRSDYVDFTLPYTESGVAMAVAIRTNQGADIWAFTRPFTLRTWFITFLFFLYTGAVVWYLEAEDVTGSQWRLLMTYMCSKLAGENVKSNLTRMVLIIWLFVVLVIASSYTANLSSILTVRQIEPQIKSLEALLQSKDPVGYPEGSFVRPFLVHHFGIEEEMLVPISSPEQYTEALRKGPQNGGVSAVIDDLISIQIFLPTKCGYKTVGPTYGFEGYGFVFQKGSPLVADFSKGVLSLSQSDQMGNIRNKWLREITCPEVEAVDNRLDLKNLWVLFLITGSASFIAVVIRFFSRLSLMSLLISNFTHFFFFRMLLRIFVYDAGKNPIGLIAS